MVAALEFHDGIAAGVAPCQAYGAHGGLGAGVDHAHQVHAGHDVADTVGEFGFQGGWRAVAQTLFTLAYHRLAHGGVIVAHDHGAPGQHVVDVALAAAIEERELAVSAAIADDRRREEELDFVSEEFQRSSVMLGRGLINESTMDTIERRFMDAKFTAERAKEAIINAKAAVRRAEIAHEIGKLDLQSAEINLGEFVLTAPFDGVLVGFDANVGDCVQEGEAAARLYEPNKKSVDVFFPISRLSAPDAAGLSIGSTVKVTRINKDTCEGTITQLDSEADPETQFVEATVVVEEGCAPNLFLNEGVEIEAEQGASTAMFTVPSDAVNDDAVFLIDENSQTAVLTPVEVISQRSQFAVISLSGGDGRLMVSAVPDGLTDGAAVSLQDPS